MSDDIVTRLRESEWNENPQTNVRLCAEAADEIERLRAEKAELLEAIRNECDRSAHLEREIERLRDAGDALVAAIRNHVLSEKDIRAWEDARRG